MNDVDLFEVGADEAGRGPWAGPIVVGVCQLNNLQKIYFNNLKIKDSKTLSAKKRQSFFYEITNNSNWAVGVVSAKEIDTLGLQKANVVAYERAVQNLKLPDDQIIFCDYVGGFKNYWTKKNEVELFVKGESKFISITAASIIAKVWRDSYMQALDKVYHGYGFGEHAGYGTKKHLNAIEQLGVCNQHRLSFAPIKKFVSR